MKTYIIAEAACTWIHGGLDAAKRSIHLAASCGANAFKTQWTSDPLAMRSRRTGGAGGALMLPSGKVVPDYSRLSWDINYHKALSEACQKEGIDYLCTVFLANDVAAIAPYVKKGKISAFEVNYRLLWEAWRSTGLPLIRSVNSGLPQQHEHSELLYCVSNYPTKLEDLHLADKMGSEWIYNGLSDHSTSVLTGAVAVGAGATILEKHVMTHDTPHDDPDYGHSLILDTENKEFSFRQYVQNVRDAEKMMYGNAE